VENTPEVHFPQRFAQLRGKTFSGVIALHSEYSDRLTAYFCLLRGGGED